MEWLALAFVSLLGAIAQRYARPWPALITVWVSTIGSALFGYWGAGNVGAILFATIGFFFGFPLAKLVLEALEPR
jgi:Na+/melibiose symporter-like transporter